jgi:adenylate kinase family enzyme
VEPSRAEWTRQVALLVERDEWIIDGNYSASLPARLSACDGVVFLDLPRWRCLWRVVRRALNYRGQTRPDMAEDCPERLEGEFLKWVWNFPKRTRPVLNTLLAQGKTEGKQIVRLRSPDAVERFLRSF